MMPQYEVREMQNLSFHERRVSAVTVILDNFTTYLQKTKQISIALEEYKSSLCPNVIETLIISPEDLKSIQKYNMFILKLPSTGTFVLVLKKDESLVVIDGRFYETEPALQNIRLGSLATLMMENVHPSIQIRFVRPIQKLAWKASVSWQKGILILIALCHKYNMGMEDVARFLIEVRRDQETCIVIGKLIEQIGYALSTSIVEPLGRNVPIMKIGYNEPITSNRNELIRIAETLGINKDQYVDPNSYATLGEMSAAELQRILLHGISPFQKRANRNNIIIRTFIDTGNNADIHPSSTLTVARNAFSKPDDMMNMVTLKLVYQRFKTKFGDAFVQTFGNEDAFIAQVVL